MNWIKQNKKLAAILGVMIAGGLGLGALLYLSWSDFSAQMSEWTDLDRNASRLENSKFTPNEANVAMLAQKLADFREKFNTLQKVLLSPSLQEPIKPITETEFQAKLKERTRAVTQKAGKVTDLPKDFALSFEEYTASLPLNADVAAELNVQLDVTEKLVNTLLDAGVKSVDLLERTHLPNERGAPAVKTPVKKPAPAPKNAKAAPVLPLTETVVDRYPIKCTFTCDQGPLQSVMNNLANPKSTPQFLVVRQLHVENAKSEAPTKEEVMAVIKPAGGAAFARPPAPLTGAAAAAAAAQRTVPAATPLPNDAAEIMGGEMLKVYLEVDYLRFRQPAAEGASAPASAPKR